MRKGFTLTEIVISIVILGLLAGIILVNVFDTKDKAIATHIEGNMAALQRATDAYYIEEDHYPTEREPSFGRPEKLLLDRLSPKYIHKADLDAVKHQTYTIDVDGRVWGSTATSPEVVFETQEGVRWTPSERAVAYDVYQDLGRRADVNHRLKKVARLEGLPETDQYLYKKKGVLLSAVDRFGKATAPTMVGTSGFVPRLDFEGTFDYVVEGDETFILDFFKPSETKPEGTSISYRFTTYDEKGDVLKKDLETFPEGEKANKIKVSIEMKGNGVSKPSLRGMLLYYHYESQEELELSPFPTDRLPQNLQEECDETCVAYEIPKGLSESQIADVYPKPEGSGSGSMSGGSGAYIKEDPTFDVRSGYILQHCKEICPPSPKLIVVKDVHLSIGEPTEEAGDVVKDPTTTPEDPEQASSIVTEKGWTTVESQFVVAGSPMGDPIHWIDAVIEDDIKDKDNTKIVYRYSYSVGKGFRGAYEELSQLPDTPSVQLTANRMVRTKMLGKTTEPEFKSATFRSEKGAVTLDGVRPTAFISYEKDNNIGRDVISTTSKVSWKYEAFDPRKKEIVETRWSGDVATSYPSSGTKTVYLEVKNSSGYWSPKASYTFDVKEEKPVAKLDATFALLRTGENVDWTKADQSYDPDGDALVDREWQGISTKYTTEGDTLTARLRVKDAEGNWSQWTELTYVTCNDVCFKGLPSNKAWDGNLGTNEFAGGKTITWTGPLEGRTITFDIAAADSSASFSVKDKNGQNLKMLVTPQNFYGAVISVNGYKRTSGTRSILSFVVPEGATSIVFAGQTVLNEVTVSSADTLSVPKNVTANSKTKEITLTWDAVPNASKYVVLSGDKVVGVSTTPSFTHKPLYSNMAYSYRILAANATGTVSREAKIDTSTLDDGINFRGLASAAAWDGNTTTFESLNSTGPNTVITWEGYLGNRAIRINHNFNYETSAFTIQDAEGNVLPAYNTTTNKYVTTFTAKENSHYDASADKRFFTFVMPKNAKKIVGNTYGFNFYEISVSDAQVMDAPTNVQDNPFQRNIALSWTPVQNAAKYLVVEDKLGLVGTTTTASFTHVPTYSAMTYSYRIFAVNASGTFSDPTLYKATTQDDGMRIRTTNILTYDRNFSTEADLIGDAVTWDSELGGRELLIDYRTVVDGTNIRFKDANGTLLPFFDNKTKTTSTSFRVTNITSVVNGRDVVSVIIPEKARSLFFTANSRIYEITIK